LLVSSGISARRLWHVYSRTYESAQEHSDWWARYQRDVKCAACAYPGPQWRISPSPIAVAINRWPAGSITGGTKSLLHFLDERLAGLLRPFAPDVLDDKAYYVGTATTSWQPYRCWVTPPSRTVDPFRGIRCCHIPCRGCGRFMSGSHADWAIVATSLDSRLVYQSDEGTCFVDDELVHKLSLRTTFPDLKFVRIPIIPEPLDGDVLPGDRGWTGVFHPQWTKLANYFPPDWLESAQQAINENRSEGS